MLDSSHLNFWAVLGSETGTMPPKHETNWMGLYYLGEWLSGFLSVATVCFGFPALFGWLLSSLFAPLFPALKLFFGFKDQSHLIFSVMRAVGPGTKCYEVQAST
jgi:hypothetical protein